MEKHWRIKRGADIRLAGLPDPAVRTAAPPARYHIFPNEAPGVRPRLNVRAGDRVRRGSPLVHDKLRPAFQWCSPAAGTVERIVLGPRRRLEQIVIAPDGTDEAESFGACAAAAVRGLGRDAVLEKLQRSGLLALLRQRPFSKLPDPAATPKSLFVNGMNTAPFQCDLAAAVRGAEPAFQAGLDALANLTPGPVHLCLPGGRADLPPALTQAKNARVHYFSGPHPAGNTSVHIHHIDAISPGDTVWTVRGADVVLIGELFLSGKLPTHRVVALGGPGVRPDACAHYRIRLGADLSALLAGRLAEGEQRVIGGDALAGTKLDPAGGLRLQDSAITVVPEGRERFLLGWMAPGFDRFSLSRLYPSTWLFRRKRWAHTTSLNGSPRAMVATGVYDRYVPMKIMTDYLIRAILAHDTDEAVQLGLLETDPEDFALPAFACLSKMDLMGIVRAGLEEVEREGL